MTEKLREQLTFENSLRLAFIAIIGWMGATSHASAKSVDVLKVQMATIIERIKATPTDREVQLMIKVAILEGGSRFQDAVPTYP